MRLIDIGANLSHQAFKADYPKVLENAKEAGIIHIIITGTDLASSRAAVDLASENPSLLSSTVGFHPHVAGSVDQVLLKQAAQLMDHEKVVAIGETGLDYNRNYSPKREQLKVFEYHLELAKTFKKPLFLHQRDAHPDFFRLLKKYRPHIIGGVVHCFTDNDQALLDYLELDMHIGVTGWICDERRGQELRKIVGKIPLNRLLIETDAPYLLPRTIKPKPKSRRNEPRYLTEIARHIARHTSCEIEEITENSSRNAIALFDLVT